MDKPHRTRKERAAIAIEAAKASALRPQRPDRKSQIDKAATVLGIASSLAAAFLFSRIEFAVPFILITLGCASFWVGEIACVRQRLPARGRIFLQFVFAAVVLGITYNPIVAEYDEQHAALLDGLLVPASKGTATKPMLQVGEGTDPIDMSTVSDNQGMRFLQDEHLKLEVENGVILISTIIRDKDDKVLLKLERNHWIVSSPPLIADKNYTKDRLEVKDARDRVVFQVHLFPDRVQMQGEWRDDTGRGVRMSSDGPGLIKNGLTMALSFLRPRSEDPQGIGDAIGRIEPIFAYPSSEHWGQLRLPAH